MHASSWKLEVCIVSAFDTFTREMQEKNLLTLQLACIQMDDPISPWHHVHVPLNWLGADQATPVSIGFSMHKPCCRQPLWHTTHARMYQHQTNGDILSHSEIQEDPLVFQASSFWHRNTSFGLACCIPIGASPRLPSQYLQELTFMKPRGKVRATPQSQ